jgi:regulator of sigma D
MMQEDPTGVASFTAELDRRKRVHQTVAELLAERQQVLVQFCSLAGRETLSDAAVTQSALQAFCQILVDYTALGHFELYERIASGKERRREVSAVAQQVYPAIARSTDLIVEFNDKYDGPDGEDSMEHLERDLSRLGESLAERFELEDRLLQALTTRRAS